MLNITPDQLPSRRVRGTSPVGRGTSPVSEDDISGSPAALNLQAVSGKQSGSILFFFFDCIFISLGAAALHLFLQFTEEKKNVGLGLLNTDVYTGIVSRGDERNNMETTGMFIEQTMAYTALAASILRNIM